MALCAVCVGYHVLDDRDIAMYKIVDMKHSVHDELGRGLRRGAID